MVNLQHVHPTTLLQAVDQLRRTFAWRTCIHSFWPLKIYLARPLTFFFLRGDFLTCVLPVFYLLLKMTVSYITLLAFTWQYTDTFYFSGGKTLSIISYFWQCFQYLNACTHWERWQIILVCCNFGQQQHFSYQKTEKRQMNDSVAIQARKTCGMIFKAIA